MKTLKEVLCGILVGTAMCILFVLLLTVRAYAQEATVVEDKPNPYREILSTMSAEDAEALEQVVYWESARSAGFDVCVAVVETVCNRKLQGGWGDTIYDICHRKRQFVCKPYSTSAEIQQKISDAITYVCDNGRTILPSERYVYFATKRQKCAKNHVFVGVDKKHQYMWFGESKK